MAVKVTFTRGKVARQVVCTVIIVHGGRNEKKEGREEGQRRSKGEHVTPPKIPPQKCGGGCGGAPR